MDDDAMSLTAERPARRKRLAMKAAAALTDAGLGGASLTAAILIRHDDGDFWSAATVGAAFSLCVFGAFLVLRVWSALWRYTSLGDAFELFRAILAANLVFVPAWFLATRLDDVPRSSLLIEVAFFTVGALGARLAVRLIKTNRLSLNRIRAARKRSIIVAGHRDECAAFIRGVQADPRTNLRIVGAIDVSDDHAGQRIRGVPMLGGMVDSANILAAAHDETDDIAAVILIGRKASAEDARRLVTAAGDAGLRVARAETPDDLLAVGHGGTLNALRLEDLLGRPQRRLDPKPVDDLLRGETVLVTGAGGSIGSELVRQITTKSVRSLVLLDQSEAGLHAVAHEVADRGFGPPRTIIADVRDRARLDHIFNDLRPDIVFHAAALKHVPLMEHNPSEAILTNLAGTMNAARAAAAAGAAAFVLISTDKAVRPVNVMGGTKRAAELFIQAMDLETPHTQFTAVRFGNVLGSAGSVVPRFEEQIARGGPVSVTHVDMKRYFMTVDEAVALTLQAAARAVGDSRRQKGEIAVLDMGEPVRIDDLARQMIRLSGLRPDIDVSIRYTGLRPGEKLAEELSWGADHPEETDVDGLMTTQPPIAPLAVLESLYREVIDLARRGDDPADALFAALNDAANAQPAAARGANVLPLKRAR